MHSPRLELEKYLSFEMDTSKKVIYLLDLTKGTKAILKTIDSNLAQKIEKHFEIDIERYGVVKEDSEPQSLNHLDKEKIYTNRFSKILFTLCAIAIITVLLFADTDAPKNVQQFTNILAYFALFVVGLVYMLILGREAYELERLAKHKLYNITSEVILDSEAKIASLEARIKELEDIGKNRHK